MKKSKLKDIAINLRIENESLEAKLADLFLDSREIKLTFGRLNAEIESKENTINHLKSKIRKLENAIEIIKLSYKDNEKIHN